MTPLTPTLINLCDSPVSVADVKAQARIDSSAEDDLLSFFVNVATVDASNRTGRSFSRMIWELRFDEFPTYEVGGLQTNRREVFIPRPPVNQILSFTYLDENDVRQDFSDYSLIRYDQYAKVVPDADWPTTNGGVIIRYEAGMNCSVPYPVKQWILLEVAHLYRNRELTVERSLSALPFGDSLLHPYMNIGV
jgi:uncharacterized phiE125 gp8 family phage protein